MSVAFLIPMATYMPMWPLFCERYFGGELELLGPKCDSRSCSDVATVIHEWSSGEFNLVCAGHAAMLQPIGLE